MQQLLQKPTFLSLCAEKYVTTLWDSEYKKKTVSLPCLHFMAGPQICVDRLIQETIKIVFHYSRYVQDVPGTYVKCIDMTPYAFEIYQNRFRTECSNKRRILC